MTRARADSFRRMLSGKKETTIMAAMPQTANMICLMKYCMGCASPLSVTVSK